MKKPYSLLLTLLLSLLVSSNVFAEDKIYMDGYLLYTINNGEITIIKYTGDEEKVEVPMTIGDYTVTKIADNSFEDTNIEELLLPETIDEISSDTLNNIDIKFYDKSGSYVEKKTEPFQDDPLIEDDPTKKDQEKQDKPSDNKKDKTEEKQTEETNDEAVEENNSIEEVDPTKDSSTEVKEGDTIEEHEDMVSEMHVSAGNRMEDEEEIINIPTHSNNTNTNTNNLNNDTTNKTHNYIYVLVVGVIGFVIYLVKKKTNHHN